MSNFSRSKTVIVIAGPTAVGKTAMAIQVARHLGTSVISADSRQCFREMTIGTAKPTPEELNLVRHYFINSHSITSEVNAGVFEKLGTGYAQEIFGAHQYLVLCGGTGLYIKAFIDGIDEMPPIPETVRIGVREYYRLHGIAGLQERLADRDAAFFRTAEKQNPHRLMRALEVLEVTGKSILTYRTDTKKMRDFNVLKIGLELPATQLSGNIRNRTLEMTAKGLVEEVRGLMPYRHLRALQTVGYQEIFAHLDGLCDLDQAVTDIQTHTRQYAKRQMTWFRKDPDIHWFPAGETDQVMAFIQQETADFAQNKRPE